MLIKKKFSELPNWIKSTVNLINSKNSTIALTAIYTYVKIMKSEYKDETF